MVLYGDFIWCIHSVAADEPEAIAVTVILTLGVVLVNGWTDAPNAIATCVSTRSMTPRNAILMAAVFNFFGVFAMTAVNAKVAQTMAKMVDFGGNTEDAVVALCAALFAIVVWATAAWYFGIPTSESHALIAGVSGAAIALQGGIDGINGAEWIKVLYGLLLSTVLGLSPGLPGREACRRAVQGHRAAKHDHLLPATARLPVRQRWPLCMGHRTARNSSGFFCWASLWRRGMPRPISLSRSG